MNRNGGADELVVNAEYVCSSSDLLEAELTIRLRRITDTVWISKSVAEAMLAHLSLPLDSLQLEHETAVSENAEDQTISEVQALSVVVEDLDWLQSGVLRYLAACK